MRGARHIRGVATGLCLLSPFLAVADVNVSRPASDTMAVSFWAGNMEIVDRAVIREGREEARPAPVLDGAEPDYSRYGAPALPFVTCSVLLPPGTAADEIIVAQTRNLQHFSLADALAFINQPYEGYDMTDPAQAQAWAADNREDAAIYGADAFYPGQRVTHTTRHFRGYTILDLSFCPFRYNPVRGDLEFARHMQISIRLAPAGPADAICGVRDSERDREIVRNMVVNRADVAAYQPEPGRDLNAPPAPSPDTNYYYVIITTAALAPSFEPLRAFHSYDATHHASIDTVEDIFAMFPPTNGEHQSIRRYMLEPLYSNGCEYVLIGGDVEVVTSYWGGSDICYSGSQFPVGRFCVTNAQNIANCIAKATNPVAAGTDSVQLIPRADEYGPTVVYYTNIFRPYLPVDIDGTLYGAPPASLFPAMDSHTILWARGHGFYLYSHIGPSWYPPNNTGIQPFGINFGCSGGVFEWNDHPAEVYQTTRYGNSAYIGTVCEVTANSFDRRFFETYFVQQTAPEPCVGDMALAAPWHSQYQLFGDPRFRIVSTQFHAGMRIATPEPTSFTRSYNIEDGTGYVESAVFRVNSWNNCPWVVTNISSPDTFSNHYVFSCLAGNTSTDVAVSFTNVTVLTAATYNATWEVRDPTNDCLIKPMSLQLIVTDKKLLTDDDFVLVGTTNVLPAGEYILIEDLVVGDGETVRLEPGVALCTDWEYGSDWKVVVQPGGKLLAVGSVTNQIRFDTAMGNPVPIEIHMTDLMPLSADFQHCIFPVPIVGSNMPVVRFINCTFMIDAIMPGAYFFPNPLRGVMKNCIISAGPAGNYGEPGDLMGMDVSYTCIAPINTNMMGMEKPGVPQHHTYGLDTIWDNDFLSFQGEQLSLLSTCINAGDPDSPLDPDGTRADLGACYYDLSGAIRVTDDYPTIQQALDAAALATAAVIVASGEYHERIQFPALTESGVRLMGASPTNRPVLVLTNDPGDLLTFEGNGYVENFVIRHTGSNRAGRAVHLFNADYVGLRHVEFSGNRDNSAVFSVASTDDYPHTCLYLWDIDFVNNASNDVLFSFQRGLMDTFTSPWPWFRIGRFASNTAIGTVFHFADDERHFPTRELVFHDNQASVLIHNAAGGTASNTTLEFLNALFHDNVGDIRAEGTGHTLFRNCTLHNNASNMTAGGSSRLGLLNSIFWDNTMTITQEPGGTVTVDYTDINAAYPTPGTGNMNTNPLFADAAGRDFRLLRVSPCIDAGVAGYEYQNEPEPDGSRVDLGCYGNTPEATPWKMWMVQGIECLAETVELTSQCTSGEWYCTEFAASVFGPWTNICDEAATGTERIVVHPLQTDRGFFRTHNYRP